MNVGGIIQKAALGGTGMVLDKGSDMFDKQVDHGEPKSAGDADGAHKGGLLHSFVEGAGKSVEKFGKQLFSPMKNGIQGVADVAKGLGDLATGDRTGAEKDFKSAGRHVVRGGIDAGKNALMVAPIVLTGGAAAPAELAGMTATRAAATIGREVAVGQTKSAAGSGLGSVAKDGYENIKAKL